MRWSYRIARISGIDVKIHVTFLLLLAWFGWIFWQQGGGPAAAEGVGFILLLFLCVLLHEFGHALAARMYGIRTPDITLLPIGGVARLERMPDKPWQELVVAVAGPAVNIVIALALFAVVATKMTFSGLSDLERADGNLIEKLMVVNVMLVLFNAIPAFPMDGGRVLRALLAMKFSYVTATSVAARVGQVMAVLFLVAGFFGSPMLMFIGVFVFFGAQQELAYARYRAAFSNRRVAEVMQTAFVALPADMTCAEADRLVKSYDQMAFPVVDSHLRAIGMLGKHALEVHATSLVPVGQIAGGVSRISAGAPVDQLVAAFPPEPLVVVENPAGQIVGIVQNPALG